MTPVAVRIIGIETAQRLEQVKGEDGTATTTPLVGTERAHLLIELSPGKVIRASVLLETVNEMIEHYDRREENDAASESLARTLDHAAAELIRAHGDAATFRISQRFDAAIEHARRLLGRDRVPKRSDVNPDVDKSHHVDEEGV